jgi:hypothetical protein
MTYAKLSLPRLAIIFVGYEYGSNANYDRNVGFSTPED